MSKLRPFDAPVVASRSATSEAKLKAGDDTCDAFNPRTLSNGLGRSDPLFCPTIMSSWWFSYVLERDGRAYLLPAAALIVGLRQSYSSAYPSNRGEILHRSTQLHQLCILNSGYHHRISGAYFCKLHMLQE